MSAALVWTLLLLAGAASAESLGSVADISDYPSIVQVEFHVSHGWVQQCAGSVLTSWHVLTAATCVSGFTYIAEERRIRAGSSISGVYGQVKPVEYSIIHPNYGLLGHDSDIAVVRLQDYLVLGDAVKQVLILGQGVELPLGLPVQLVAWGSTAEGNEDPNPELYSINLSVNDNDWCLLQYLYSESRPVITENMLCVGLTYLTGRDFDGNDAGAPVFYDGTLVGVASFGFKADNQFPAVTTLVSSYTQWIIDNASQ